jgi:hypothetical protein
MPGSREAGQVADLGHEDGGHDRPDSFDRLIASRRNRMIILDSRLAGRVELGASRAGLASDDGLRAAPCQ